MTPTRRTRQRCLRHLAPLVVLAFGAATASATDVHFTRMTVKERSANDTATLSGGVSEPSELVLPTSLEVRTGRYTETIAAASLVHNPKKKTLAYKAPKGSIGVRSFRLSLKSGKFTLSVKGRQIGTPEDFDSRLPFSLRFSGCATTGIFKLRGTRATRVWRNGDPIRVNVTMHVLDVGHDPAGGLVLGPSAGRLFVRDDRDHAFTVVSQDASVNPDGTWRATIELTDPSALARLDLTEVLGTAAGATAPGRSRIATFDDGGLSGVVFVEPKSGAVGTLNPGAASSLRVTGTGGAPSGAFIVPGGAVAVPTPATFLPCRALQELPAPVPEVYTPVAGALIGLPEDTVFDEHDKPTVEVSRPSWAQRGALASSEVRLLRFVDGVWVQEPGHAKYDPARDVIGPDPLDPARIAGPGAVVYAVRSTAPPVVGGRDIEGRVVDAEGRPVAGRVVMTRAEAVVTDSDGRFAVRRSSIVPATVEVVQVVGDGTSTSRALSPAESSKGITLVLDHETPLSIVVGQVAGSVFESGGTTPSAGAVVTVNVPSSNRGLSIDARGTPDAFGDDSVCVPDLTDIGVTAYAWHLTIPGDAAEFASAATTRAVAPSDLLLEAQSAGRAVAVEGAFTIRVTYGVASAGEVDLYACFRVSLDRQAALSISDVQLPALVSGPATSSFVASTSSAADGSYSLSSVPAPLGLPVTLTARRADSLQLDAETIAFAAFSRADFEFGAP